MFNIFKKKLKSFIKSEKVGEVNDNLIESSGKNNLLGKKINFENLKKNIEKNYLVKKEVTNNSKNRKNKIKIDNSGIIKNTIKTKKKSLDDTEINRNKINIKKRIKKLHDTEFNNLRRSKRLKN